MPTLSGMIVPSGYIEDMNSEISVSVNHGVDSFAVNFYGQSGDVCGTKSDNKSILVANRAPGGTNASGFGDIIFERVFIIIAGDFYYGNTITTGLVVFPASFPAELWNSYRSQVVTLNAITWTDGTGISVSGFSTPLSIGKLQTIAFNFLVSNVGPLLISASGTFEFSVGTLPILITGLRGLPVTIPPDRDAYAEVRNWATDIFTSTDKTEQRQSLMTSVKREVDFKFTPNTQQEVNLMENLIFMASKYLVVQPLWFSKTVLTQATNVLSTTIYLDTTLGEFAIDQYVLIRMTDDYYDVKKIVTVNGNSLVLDNYPLAFPVGATVVPLIQVTVDVTTSYSGKYRRFISFDAKMKEVS